MEFSWHACWVIFHALIAVCQLFFKVNSFRNTITGSNSLDPDQDRHFVWSDFGPNCLQILAADDCLQILAAEDKSCLEQGKS